MLHCMLLPEKFVKLMINYLLKHNMFIPNISNNLRIFNLHKNGVV